MESSSSRLSDEQLYSLIKISFDNYIAGLGYAKDLYISPPLLMNAIKSSRIDESRHCDFHPIVPARSKSAAWFMYWLIKLKPIQIKHKSVTIPTEGLYINETFAFFIAIKILKVKSKSLSQRFFKQFVYMLVYRDNMAKPLFITLQLLQIAVERAPELPIE